MLLTLAIIHENPFIYFISKVVSKLKTRSFKSCVAASICDSKKFALPPLETRSKINYPFRSTSWDIWQQWWAIQRSRVKAKYLGDFLKNLCASCRHCQTFPLFLHAFEKIWTFSKQIHLDLDRFWLNNSLHIRQWVQEH